MFRSYLFPILAVACLAVSALAPSAALAAPFLSSSFRATAADLASPTLLRLSHELRALTGPTGKMAVAGMPAAERSGASASMLNGPILAPVRGFEISSARG